MPRPNTRTTRARQTAKPTATVPEPDNEPRGRSRRTRSINDRISTGDIEAAKINRDAALADLANESTTADDSNGSIEVGRRADTPQRRDTTGLDLDLGDDMFGNLDDSFELPQVDNSSLFGNSSHIKPRSRSRQSSIIGRNDISTRPASRAGATPMMSSSFNIGAFRRRAREPSILGTGRKSRADTSRLTTTTNQDHESSESELEDFMPEAESTPVNNRRRTRASMNQETEEAELPVPTGSRKRKSAGADEASDRPEKVARSDEAEVETAPELEPEVEPEAASESESESALSELATPTLPGRMIQRPVTPDREASYMAPPASSDSEASRDFWPDIHGLAKKRRIIATENADNLSNVSSPPSLTHSPNFAQGNRSKSRGRSRVRKSPSPLTTADLANLLPRRRQKKARDDEEEESDEEMDGSGLANDQDELSYLNARSTRRTRSRAASARSASRNKKQKAASKTRSKTRGANRRRTYGRNSDKENENDEEEAPDADTSAFEPQAADETTDEITSEAQEYPSLKLMAKKFEEVDQWEMSFEEASEPEDDIAAR